jgi:hypothetical protein
MIPISPPSYLGSRPNICKVFEAAWNRSSAVRASTQRSLARVWHPSTGSGQASDSGGCGRSVTGDLRPTAITGLQMAPEGRRTAVLDGLHHAALWRADPMRTAIGLAVFAEDVRELQPPCPRLGFGDSHMAQAPVF